MGPQTFDLNDTWKTVLGCSSAVFQKVQNLIWIEIHDS